MDAEKVSTKYANDNDTDDACLTGQKTLERLFFNTKKMAVGRSKVLR